MEMEGKQAEHIAKLVEQFFNLKTAELTTVIVEATSHASVFSFSEILSVPNILELEGTENSTYLDLLRIFAHGTWRDYKDVVSHLPPLDPDQVLKLKQLTMLTLAETEKVLPYDTLMQELDFSNVQELEDFLITNCIYVGIVTGRLNHIKRCFEVQVAAERDIKPEQLDSMIQKLECWLSMSDGLLVSIEENIQWTESMHEMDNKHKMELNQMAEDMKKTLFPKKQDKEKNLRDLAEVIHLGKVLVSLKRRRRAYV